MDKKAPSNEDNLNNLRQEIDAIDLAIKDLLLQRFQVVNKVQELKAKEALPILDKHREAKQEEDLKKGLSPDITSKVLRIFSEIRSQSKQVQLAPGKSNVRVSIGIVGMGLMGGSLYKAIKAHHPHVALNAWDKTISEQWPKSTLEDTLRCQYVFLALPVNAIKKFLSENKSLISDSTTVIDFGSTKETIVDSLHHLNVRWKFIPAHPLVGKELSGFENSEANLYHGKNIVICDKELFEQDEVLIQILEGVGLNCVFMSPKEHDLELAATSHLPHLIALALVQCIDELNVNKSILPKSLKDMTRIAGASGEMWEDIFTNNKDAILSANEVFEKKLKDIRSALSSVSDLFKEAKQFRKEYCDDHSYEVIPRSKGS